MHIWESNSRKGFALSPGGGSVRFRIDGFFHDGEVFDKGTFERIVSRLLEEFLNFMQIEASHHAG